MLAAPRCPRCRGALHAPGLMDSAWSCPSHGHVAPLHAAIAGSNDHLGQLAARAMVPLWLPWPLPRSWLVTGLTYAGDERSGAVATVVACSGPNPLPDGGPSRGATADLLLVAEQPGVGLGASLAGLPEVDAGESLTGALRSGGPQAKVHAAGQLAHLWHVPAGPELAAYVGEALGVWLWLVLWPATAGALLAESLHLVDARSPGHPIDVPTGAPSPRLDWSVAP